MNADELVSALVDDGADPPIEPPRDAVAQRLFIHGLLASRGASPEVAVRRALHAIRPRTWRRVGSVAASILLVAGLLLLMLQGDALPEAEAVMERVQASMREPVDRHFVAVVTENGRHVRTNDWYCRGDLWTMRHDGRIGESWFGGDGRAVWWLTPRGVVRRWDDLGAFREAAKGIDPTLPYANLSRALQELSRDTTLATVGREGDRVRIRAVRKTAGPGIRAAELWADEASGVLDRVELLFEFENRDARLHVLTRVETPARDERFYQPEGHAR